MSETKKRGQLGGTSLNTKSVQWFNISNDPKNIKIIEIKEYFREITYAGGWAFEDMLYHGHTLLTLYIGTLGTTPGRTNKGKYASILNICVPIKEALLKNVLIPRVDIVTSDRFKRFREDLFTNFSILLDKNDAVVINEMTTQRNGLVFTWKRVSMPGISGTKVAKLVLYSINGYRLYQLHPNDKQNIMSIVGTIAKPDACCIKKFSPEEKISCNG